MAITPEKLESIGRILLAISAIVGAIGIIGKILGLWPS